MHLRNKIDNIELRNLILVLTFRIVFSDNSCLRIDYDSRVM